MRTAKRRLRRLIAPLGVATAMHSHLQQKMDSIAIMKCLGARSGQIIRIYVSQTLALGLAGGLAGIALGLAMASSDKLLRSSVTPAFFRPLINWP